MAGFGIQKRGTSKILVKRKGFSEGSYPLVDEVPEPKMERMPSNEDKDYTPKKERMPSNDNKDYTPKKARISSDDNESFTKETRLGKNQFKVERVKKSDDEIGYQKESKNKKFVSKEERKGMKKGGSAKKDTHITKDGRVAKKGLYYYMNRAKKLGKSKPGKGTVSDKALKASAKTSKK